MPQIQQDGSPAPRSGRVTVERPLLDAIGLRVVGVRRRFVEQSIGPVGEPGAGEVQPLRLSE